MTFAEFPGIYAAVELADSMSSTMGKAETKLTSDIVPEQT
jgi:hypothetical protein